MSNKNRMEFSSDTKSTNIKTVESNSTNEHGEGTSVLGTFYNIVCVTAGIGILGIPSAVATGGWISILFIALSGLMSIYTGNLLIKCLYCRSDRRLETYSEIGLEAFGKPGKLIVQVCHYSIILGSACLCIMLPGLNAFSMASEHNINIDIKIWILLSGIIVGIPYCILRKMKEFIWMAIFGFLTTLIVLVIVVILSIIDAVNLPTLGDHQIAIPAGIPLALATFSISYAGNVVFPHLEGAMKQPKKWPIALASGLGTVTLFYLLMASVGYYAYGDSVQSPIFRSLPSNAANYAAQILIIVHVLMAAPILLCSFGLETETILSITPGHTSKTKGLIYRTALRIFTVACLILIAMFIPYFGDFMSIIGSIFNSMIIFFIPISCHFKLFGIRGRKWYEYIFATITLIMAAFCLVLGAIDSIRSLVKSIEADYK